MKIAKAGKLVLVSLLLSFYASALYSQQLAFPTAEGYGKYATGGRGGKVIEVTNLYSSGPGSFAVVESGPPTREKISSNVRTHTFIFLYNVIYQDNCGVFQRQHIQDYVYWSEKFEINDITQTEDEIKAVLKDIPTIFIVAA